MTKKAQNFEMIAGDTINLRVSVVDPALSNAPKNITGATIKWVLYNEETLSAALTKQTGGGITITDGLNGLFTVTLAPTDTVALTPGVYYHEAETTDQAGNVATVFIGNVTVLPTRI